MRQIDEETRRELTRGIVFMNDETWQDYVSQDKLTILHFLSSVDLVSREQIPMIREFAAKYGDKYTVGVLDAGLCPRACESCQVQALPTLSVLRNSVLLAAYQGQIYGEARSHKHDSEDGGENGGHGCGCGHGHSSGIDMSEFVLQLNAWQQMDMSRD